MVVSDEVDCGQMCADAPPDGSSSYVVLMGCPRTPTQVQRIHRPNGRGTGSLRRATDGANEAPQAQTDH